MQDYLTYEQYQSFGGVLDNSAFMLFSNKASCIIDNETFNRAKSLGVERINDEGEIAKEYPLELQLCMYDLIVFLQGNAPDGSGKKIASESNGGLSASYALSNTNDADAEQERIILTWLSNLTIEDGTPLLYAGITEGRVVQKSIPVPEQPSGEYATIIALQAETDARIQADASTLQSAIDFTEGKICGLEFYSASDIAVWTSIPGHVESLIKGAILRTLNDDPDFEFKLDIATGKYVLIPLPKVHATKVETADGKTVQEVIDALTSRIAVLEARI